MAQIKKIDVTTSTYQGKEKKSYLLTLDDGTTGYPAKDPWDYKEGESVSYTKEVKKSKQGKDYNVLTLTKTPITEATKQEETKPDELILPRTRGISQAKTIQEMKYEGRVYCLKLAVKCLVVRAIEYPQVKEYFNEWVDLIDASIDEIKG